MIRTVLSAAFVSCLSAAALTAQQGATTTPQTTPQSKSSSQGQQLTLSGCVGNVAPGQSAAAGATTGGRSQQYSLNQLQWTGASGTQFDDWMRANPRRGGANETATSPALTRPTELALHTTGGSSVDLSKYAGQNVAVTGTYTWAGPGRTGTSGTGRGQGQGQGQGQMQSQWPVFMVTSVKVLSTKCGGF